MMSVKSFFKVWKGNKAIKLFILIKIIQFIYMRPAFELKVKKNVTFVLVPRSKTEIKDLWIKSILVKANHKSCVCPKVLKTLLVVLKISAFPWRQRSAVSVCCWGRPGSSSRGRFVFDWCLIPNHIISRNTWRRQCYPRKKALSS